MIGFGFFKQSCQHNPLDLVLPHHHNFTVADPRGGGGARGAVPSRDVKNSHSKKSMTNGTSNWLGELT